MQPAGVQRCCLASGRPHLLSWRRPRLLQFDRVTACLSRVSGMQLYAALGSELASASCNLESAPCSGTIRAVDRVWGKLAVIVLLKMPICGSASEGQIGSNLHGRQVHKCFATWRSSGIELNSLAKVLTARPAPCAELVRHVANKLLDWQGKHAPLSPRTGVGPHHPTSGALA